MTEPSAGLVPVSRVQRPRRSRRGVATAADRSNCGHEVSDHIPDELPTCVGEECRFSREGPSGTTTRSAIVSPGPSTLRLEAKGCGSSAGHAVTYPALSDSVNVRFRRDAHGIRRNRVAQREFHRPFRCDRTRRAEAEARIHHPGRGDGHKRRQPWGPRTEHVRGAWRYATYRCRTGVVDVEDAVHVDGNGRGPNEYRADAGPRWSLRYRYRSRRRSISFRRAAHARTRDA